ncbi:MAG TPA: methyltransferase domain-containing protein [Terriglobia bacterium]|nr:methyltransferase domain-containing protein [Terriglobia bacterium]
MSERLRQEFNQWAQDGPAAALELHHRGFFEPVIHRMEIQPAERILEIGCGEGWALRMLSPLVPQGILVGLDFSDDMVRNARAQSTAYDNLLFVWSSAEQIPWQENFFTTIFSLEAFYYIEDPERALREIYRVLVPGGRLWIVNHLCMENEWSLRWLPWLSVPARLLRADEYVALLERCGFAASTPEMIPGQPPDGGAAPPPFRDAAEWRRCYERGALLLSARKPAT